jgi:hypothetical protein
MQGWAYLNQNPVRKWLALRRLDAAALLGVSAGAIHLSAGVDESGTFRHYLDWLPWPVAVHEESLGWPSVQIMQRTGCEQVMTLMQGEALWCVRGQLRRFQARRGGV